MAVQNKLSAFDSYDIYFTFTPVTALVNVISVLNTGNLFAKVQSMYPSISSLKSKSNALPIQSCTLINPNQAGVL